MEMEARSYSPDQARQLLQKSKEYKADLLKLKEDARRATTAGGSGGAAGEATRAELGLGADFYQTSAGQRDRLLTATDRLGKTSDRIQQGRQQLLETEVRAGRGCWMLHACVVAGPPVTLLPVCC
jgi:vesicle transport through interaction with t-SNAREs protein 1